MVFSDKISSAVKITRKGLKNTVSAFAGWTGGIIAGYLFKWELKILNFNKFYVKLSECLSGVIREILPTVNTDHIRLMPNARGIPKGIDAVTFGYEIYIKGVFSEENYYDLKLLLHEMVHVRQYEEKGKFLFKAHYGFGYVSENFSYENIPLEKEAREFVNNQWKKFEEKYRTTCISSV